MRVRDCIFDQYNRTEYTNRYRLVLINKHLARPLSLSLSIGSVSKSSSSCVVRLVCSWISSDTKISTRRHQKVGASQHTNNDGSNCETNPFEKLNTRTVQMQSHSANTESKLLLLLFSRCILFRLMILDKKAKAKGGGGTRVGPKFLGLRVSPGAVSSSSSSSSQYWLDCVTVVVAKARTNRIIQSLQMHYTALNALYYSRKPTTDLRHDIDKILSHARTHTQTNKLQYNTTQYNTTQ